MKKIFALLLAALATLGAAELKIGTAANYPPFEYVDEQNKITGFDMDLVAELAKRAGFEYKIVNMSFDGLIPALKTGKIDAVASAMSATDDRRKSVDFTQAYYATENIYLRAKGNDAIAGAKDVPAEDPVPLIMGLKKGKIDAVVLDSSIGYGFLKKNPELEEFYKETDGSEGFSMAFDKGKQADLIAKINAALEEMKKDGSYDKLLEKYDLK